MPFTSSIFTFWWETQSHPYRPATPNRFRWGTGTTRAEGPGTAGTTVDSPRWFNFRDARRAGAAIGTNQSRFDYFGWQ